MNPPKMCEDFLFVMAVTKVILVKKLRADYIWGNYRFYSVWNLLSAV
jgi:hypothetical protein